MSMPNNPFVLIKIYHFNRFLLDQNIFKYSNTTAINLMIKPCTAVFNWDPKD